MSWGESGDTRGRRGGRRRWTGIPVALVEKTEGAKEGGAGCGLGRKVAEGGVGCGRKKVS